MNIMKKISLLGLSFLTLPHVAMAQFDGSDVKSLIVSMHGLINKTLIPIFVALALTYVIYAVVTFIAAGDDTQKKEEKKQQIFWGIIGLFIIVSIWALVAVVGRTFGIFAGGTLSV